MNDFTTESTEQTEGGEAAFSKSREVLRELATQAESRGDAAGAACFEFCAVAIWDGAARINSRMAAWRRLRK